MDDIDDNLDKISTKINELPAVTKQQDKRDLLEFQARADSVDSKMEQTVKGLLTKQLIRLMMCGETAR